MFTDKYRRQILFVKTNRSIDTFDIQLKKLRTWPNLCHWFLWIPICILKKLRTFSDISKCSMSISFWYLYIIFRQVRSKIWHHREVTFSMLATFLKQLQNWLFLDNLVGPWFFKSSHLRLIDRILWKLVCFVHLTSTRGGLNLFKRWFGLLNLRSGMFWIGYIDRTGHLDLCFIAISHRRSMHWMTVLWFQKGLFLFNFTHNGFFLKAWLKYRHIYHIANHLQLRGFHFLLKLNLGF